MKIGIIIQGYEINALANGYVLAKSPTAPSPYAVWQIDDDGKGVCCGQYFVDREEAEWAFCARAFEWFEDNMYIHMIEDKEEHSETHSVFEPMSEDDGYGDEDKCGTCKYNTGDFCLSPELRRLRR